MKENRGKEVVNEAAATGQDTPQSHPSVGEKRKNLSLGVDLGNLPSRRREKKVKHKSSKPKDVQPAPTVHEPVDVQILDSEPKDSPMQVPSIVKTPSTSLPPPQAPQHLIGNEDLAWERFKMAVTDEDVSACYNMSLKDFEHSGVHDLFKVCIYSLLFFILSRPL